MINVLKKTIFGILIGAAYILPGISGGVLCVIFGIYEKLLNSILNFFSDIKNNCKYIIPIIIGAVVGVLVFSKLLNYLFYAYPIQTKSIFIGTILGGIPSILKKEKMKNSWNLKNIIYLIIALLFGILTVFLEEKLPIRSQSYFNNFYLILSGFFMSIGVVVPGVSSTIILMLFGTYSIYLNSIASLYFPVLIPIGIGLIIGSLFFMKFINYLLMFFYVKTFYSIIGFSIGSILVLMPNISSIIELIICMLGILLGLLISSILLNHKTN